MTERFKKFLNGNGTFLWRTLACFLIAMAVWQWNRLVCKVDALEEATVKKSEIVEIKTDIKNIEKTLNTELPKISKFIGGVEQYMKDR